MAQRIVREREKKTNNHTTEQSIETTQTYIPQNQNGWKWLIAFFWQSENKRMRFFRHIYSRYNNNQTIDLSELVCIRTSVTRNSKKNEPSNTTRCNGHIYILHMEDEVF